MARDDLAELPNARDFTWHDGRRVVRFGDGAFDEAKSILEANGWNEFELLSTSRALGEAPAELVDAASAVHEVPAGKVADTSAALIDAVGSDRLVALGGGRVIDTAKAIAAVRDGETAAIPTTLSGAEMTRFHRLPEGRTAPRLNRPAIAIADPTAMTSLPEEPLRATALNSLGHGADALFGPVANPFSTLSALHGIELLAASLDQPSPSATAPPSPSDRSSAPTRSTGPASRFITPSARSWCAGWGSRTRRPTRRCSRTPWRRCASASRRPWRHSPRRSGPTWTGCPGA